VSERLFPGGPIVDFSNGNHKDFSKKGGKIGEISFYPLENENIFAENLIGKCQISKYRRVKPLLCFPSEAHAAELRFQT